MPRDRLLLKTFAALAFCLVPCAARADVVTITGGTFDHRPPVGGGTLYLEGPGVRINALTGSSSAAAACNTGCFRGANFLTVFSASGGDAGGGTAVINGVTYTFSLSPSVFITSAGGVIPLDAGPGLTQVVVPITFQIPRLGGVLNPNANIPEVVFTSTAPYVFTGVAVVDIMPDPTLPDLFVIRGVTYSFGSAAPVPEPATLALLGAGLAGLAAASRRRRIN